MSTPQLRAAALLAAAGLLIAAACSRAHGDGYETGDGLPAFPANALSNNQADSDL